MNFPKDINRASWLSVDDREKLLALYKTVEDNPLFPAIDLLNFGFFRSGEVLDPYQYKIIIAQLLTVVKDKTVLRTMNGTGLRVPVSAETVLGNLYAFFDELDSDGFTMCIRIDEMVQYPNEARITPNELYNIEMEHLQKKLKALEGAKSA